MVNLSLAIAPHIDGAVHVMSNPNLTSTLEIVRNAKRELSSTHLRLLAEDYGLRLDTSRDHGYSLSTIPNISSFSSVH